MTTTDKLIVSFTDAVLSKGKIMKYISAHIRCEIIDEIGKMETEVMTAQHWKAETAPDKKKDPEQKRE